MCAISNSRRSYSYGETSWDSGDIEIYSPESNENQKIIHKANTISILQIFKFYGMNIGMDSKITCPFPIHKGGKEKTPSFYYYTNTNSFNCFGCNNGGGCCQFVAVMDNISVIQAAHKIMNLFGDQTTDDNDFLSQKDLIEKLQLMLEFSTSVREFRQIHSDIQSYDFIENLCKVYDHITNKHNLNNSALKFLNSNLINKINKFRKN
jgi:DNA primase